MFFAASSGGVRVERAALVVTVAAATTLLTGWSAGSSRYAASGGCGTSAGYSYAGFQHAYPAPGIRATITTLSRPEVESGHVAAWVGIGGRGLGAGGTDAWIQIGVSSFSDGPSELFYEVNSAGAGVRYTPLGVPAGVRYRVAVRELAARRGWWQAWLDGNPVSPAIHLPGSSGRWRPIATAETWDGGRRVCNRFAYRFAAVAVGTRSSWSGFVVGHRFQDPGYRAMRMTSSMFMARAMERPGS
jgi:hypothetical protein